MQQLPGTISPKVALPAFALVVLGVGCAITGVVFDSAELTSGGVALIGGSGLTGAVGFRAPPGTVITNTADVASDDLLDPDVRKRLEAE